MTCNSTKQNHIKPWFSDIGVLLKSPGEFWPSKHLSENENINAITRFVIYSTLILSALRRSVTVLVVGLVVVAVIGFIYSRRKKRDMLLVIENAKSCRRPTLDNPYMNTPTHEFGKAPIRKPCCVDPDVVDAIASQNLIIDADDLYRSTDLSNRPWLTLPNGGQYPDYSALKYGLEQGSNLLETGEHPRIPKRDLAF